MSTAHITLKVIAFIFMGLSCLFWMFAKLDTGGRIIVKLLTRGIAFVAAVWLVLEILGVKY